MHSYKSQHQTRKEKRKVRFLQLHV